MGCRLWSDYKRTVETCPAQGDSAFEWVALWGDAHGFSSDGGGVRPFNYDVIVSEMSQGVADAFKLGEGPDYYTSDPAQEQYFEELYAPNNLHGSDLRGAGITRVLAHAYTSCFASNEADVSGAYIAFYAGDFTGVYDPSATHDDNAVACVRELIERYGSVIIQRDPFTTVIIDGVDRSEILIADLSSTLEITKDTPHWEWENAILVRESDAGEVYFLYRVPTAYDAHLYRGVKISLAGVGLILEAETLGYYICAQ